MQELGFRRPLLASPSLWWPYQLLLWVMGEKLVPLKTVAQVAIRVGGEEHQCTVAPGQTILAACLAAGIDTPFSCQSGICGTCQLKCVEGKVALGDNGVMTPEKLDAGYVLICVGYPATDKVVLAVE